MITEHPREGAVVSAIKNPPERVYLMSDAAYSSRYSFGASQIFSQSKFIKNANTPDTVRRAGIAPRRQSYENDDTNQRSLGLPS